MEIVTIDALEPEPEGDVEVDRRSLSGPLGTTDVAANYYALDPGESFVAGLHAHMDQEEIFFVLEGTVTFETTRDPAADPRTVAVESGQVVRFGRGEYQQGRNEGHEQATAIALGAPPNSTSGREPRTCPDCSESEYLDTAIVDGQLKAQCPACESIHESGLH
jgi:mannose-6-phosphate isomerase-like protein (cupin superfamily)